MASQEGVNKRGREEQSDDDDDDDFKVHPKKSSEQLGTLAASSNTWYENDQDEEDVSDDDEDESSALPLPSFPTMGRVPAPTSLPTLTADSNKKTTARELMKTPASDLVASTGEDVKLRADLIAYVTTLQELLEGQDSQK